MQRFFIPSVTLTFPKQDLRRLRMVARHSTCQVWRTTGWECVILWFCGKCAHIPQTPICPSGSAALMLAALRGSSGCLSWHQSSAQATCCPLAFEHSGFTLVLLLLPKELVEHDRAGHHSPKLLGWEMGGSGHQKCLIQSLEGLQGLISARELFIVIGLDDL